MTSTPTHRPDILLIYTDQWRWDALGCLGSEALTPSLDALVAEGALFDHAIVQSPVCMPSRASMLTGQYPSTLGITAMGVPVPESTETIATLLNRRGWTTANIGKLHFLPHANRDHSSPHPNYGFDVLALSDEPGVYEDDYRAWVRSVAPEALGKLSTGLPPAAQVWEEQMGSHGDVEHSTTGARNDYGGVTVFDAPSELTHTAWVASRTIEHLESLAAGEAAFTVASFFSPHSPYNVPQEFIDLYDRDSLSLPQLSDQEKEQQIICGLTDDRLRTIRHGYYAAISEVDHHVGRILDFLKRSDRYKNTIVVFVSDHGEWLGDHLRVAKGYPADDPVSRVPLIIRLPKAKTSPGRTVTTIVEAIDIVPTLLEAVGVPTPRNLQGRSLLPALHGKRLEGPEVGLTEHLGWRSVRTPDHRYLVHSDGSEKLWDLSNDPNGHRDVSSDPEYARILARHRLSLLQRILGTERNLPRTWPY